MADREDISRGLAEPLEYKDVAIRISRDPSIVSRVTRYGGRAYFPRGIRITSDPHLWPPSRLRPTIGRVGP